MKLLGTALSPYAMRVLVAARYKGIDLPLEETAPQSPEILAHSPIGKVPVLVDGNLVLPESDVILGYLDDRAPKPPLYPGDARARASVRLMVRLMDAYSTPSFGPFLPGADPADTAAAVAKISDALRYVDHFRPDGRYAAGDEFSAADCAWIPFFRFFEILEPTHGVYALVRRYPQLDSWWCGTKESEIGKFACTTIDTELAKLMRRSAAQ